MELWDLIDKDRNPLRRTHNRKDPMIPGEYHIVVEILTVTSQGQLLITLRDHNKEKIQIFGNIQVDLLLQARRAEKPQSGNFLKKLG